MCGNAVITINTLPTVNVPNVTVCTGLPGTLTTNAPTAASYKWFDGSTLSIYTTTTPGNYCVTITDGNGCTNSACGNIYNYSVPKVNVPYVTVCTGLHGTLTANASDSSKL